MELTNLQEKGLKIACERYRNKEPYTVIAGYAGTGKSTLVEFIIDALGLYSDEVAYVAYTGKASLVLQNKGCEGAMTSHKLLYNTKEKVDGTYEHIPKDKLDEQYKLIIVDEISMLPDELWQLLLFHKTPIIALGDSFQLPPIGDDNHVLDKPHIFLDEVMRQAKENPIIRLSIDIREGRWVEYGGPKEARIMHKEDISSRLLIGADQVLCGKNSTRHSVNSQMRRYKWGDKYSDSPIDGDKVICLKNMWSTLSDDGSPLINGMIGKINNVKIKDSKYFHPQLKAKFASECNGLFHSMSIDYQLITTGEPTINKNNWHKYPKQIRPYEFAYGDCITVHKSQGSQWDKVLIFDEWLGDRQYHARWLYTGITRAAEKVVIAR